MAVTTTATNKEHLVIPSKSKKQQSYKNFVNAIRAKRTRINYVHYVDKFMLFHSITSYDALLKGDNLLIESRIIQWLSEDNSISNISKSVYIAAIKKFYDMNRMTLAWKIILCYLGEKERAHQDRAYSEEELLKMYNEANVREKMVLTLMVSAGL